MVRTPCLSTGSLPKMPDVASARARRGPLPAPPAPVATRRRVIDSALRAFGTTGYDATSLDALAADLGITKQTILYHFSSKEVLLAAVIDDAGAELRAVIEDGLVRSEPGWGRIEAVVRSVFRLAGRRPELLGLLREAIRLGPPPATRLREQLDPFITRATAFLEDEMDAGQVRRTDARLLLLAAYSTVIGVATEVEVLRALGVEPTGRSLVRRRAELLGFLRSALVA